MFDLTEAPASLPPDRRVYAIGDVHGSADRLAALHGLIEQDLASRPIGSALLVHLGDYVDRGPDSAAVLRRIAQPPPRGICRMVNLCGNHEAMMLDALEAAGSGAITLPQQWLQNGGTATLASFGAADQPARHWAAAIGEAVIGQLRAFKLRHAEGGYFFTHAGVRPGVSLAHQAAEDLLWIREPFLSSMAEHGAVIVHGHTPARAPQLRANRIGIDTGAAMGGSLTCLVLEGARLGLMSS